MLHKYLAVLGGNLMACPAITRLKERGHKILVVDGNPESPAQLVADRFINHDFLDPVATCQVLRNETLTGVMPLNDFAIASAAALSKERGLPGWGLMAEQCFRSKVAMKKSWHTAGLPTAKFHVTTVSEVLSASEIQWATWPCIVKPSFSGGGSRGVFLASNMSEVKSQLARLQTKYLDHEVVFEEYIKGSEHTIEVVVFRGEPYLLSISDKQNYPGSFTVVKNLYFPGPVGHANKDTLEALVVKACNAMQLTDGAAHFEVLLADGAAFLLEVGGRPGGGINFHPICELSTGYDYPTILGSILTGESPNFSQTSTEHLAWHYFPNGTGILEAVIGFDELENDPCVVDAALYEKVGSMRMDLGDDLARPGYVLVKGVTHEAAKSHADMLIGKLTFVAT